MIERGAKMRGLLEKTGIGQTELARWGEVTSRAVRFYVSGQRPVDPMWIALLEYLSERPEAIQWFRDRAAKKYEDAPKRKVGK